MEYAIYALIGFMFGFIIGMICYAFYRYKKTSHPGHLYISDDQQFYLELEEELKYKPGTWVVFDIRRLNINERNNQNENN